MDRWRQVIFANRPGFNGVFKYDINQMKESDSKTVLVMDSHLPHKDKQIIKNIEESNGSHVAIIPGGMTPLLQPVDLGWGKLLKGNIKNYWHNWITQKIEAKEKVAKPSYQEICDWVVDAWEAIPSQFIIGTFESVNLGKISDETKIHSRLLNIMSDIPLDLVDLEQTGISDAESDEGELEVTLDLANLDIGLE